MTISGIDKIDIDSISPGDHIKLKIQKTHIVEQLLKHANSIGCKLIYLNYGEFFFKDFRSVERDRMIDDLLE
jgi:hypothetical protein